MINLGGGVIRVGAFLRVNTVGLFAKNGEIKMSPCHCQSVQCNVQIQYRGCVSTLAERPWELQGEELPQTQFTYLCVWLSNSIWMAQYNFKQTKICINIINTTYSLFKIGLCHSNWKWKWNWKSNDECELWWSHW